jgi:hypothetical protein
VSVKIAAFLKFSIFGIFEMKFWYRRQGNSPRSHQDAKKIGSSWNSGVEHVRKTHLNVIASSFLRSNPLAVQEIALSFHSSQ